MNKVLKYNQAKYAILDLIARGHLEIGDRLPTLREMRSMFPVSDVSIRRALSDLEAEGYISKRQGAGTFLTKSIGASVSRGTILYLQVDPVSATIPPGVTFLRQYLLDRQIRLEAISRARPDGDIVPIAKECIAIFASGFITEEWVRFLSTLSRPVLFIGMNEATLKLPSVAFDWRMAVEMSMKRLARLGARRIGLLNGDEGWYPAHMIADEYIEQGRRLGLEVSKEDILWKTTYGGLEVGKFLEERPRYDGLVVEGGALRHLLICSWQGRAAHRCPVAVLGSESDHLSSDELFFVGFEGKIFIEAGKALFSSLSDPTYFKDGPRLMKPHFIPEYPARPDGVSSDRM